MLQHISKKQCEHNLLTTCEQTCNNLGVFGSIHEVIINDAVLILFLPDLVYPQWEKWNIQTLLIGDSLPREAVGFDRDSKQIMQI